MTALTEFLYPTPAKRAVGSIVTWWERRRLAYNVIVGGAGVVGVGAAMLIGLLPPGSALFRPPLLEFLVIGAIANVCYLLGPTVEIAVDKIFGPDVMPTGPALFRMGLTFSVGIGLLPILLSAIMWVVRAVGALL